MSYATKGSSDFHGSSDEYLEIYHSGVFVNGSVDKPTGFLPDPPENYEFNVGFSNTKESIIFSSYYNLVNAIEHERDHYDKFLSFYNRFLNSKDIPTFKSIESYHRYMELQAIYYQRQQNSWNMTTEKFKNAINEYEKKYRSSHN